MSELSRRALFAGLSATAALSVAGCSATRSQGPQIDAALVTPPGPGQANIDEAQIGPEGDLNYSAMYAKVEGDAFPIPAVDLSRIGRAFLRRPVDYATTEAPGTIIVDPHAHYLYHVLGNGRAMRYGVGVGREGFLWAGTAMIHDKQEWPDWYPPKEMFDRQPEIKKEMSKLQSGLGMHGGPGNPLGARAMYLWENNKDTLYRIHGTVEPWTIGTSVSSGCIRMINQDAMNLYGATPVGTKVVVLAVSNGGVANTASTTL